LNSNKLLGSLKHVINLVMRIRYMGCYSLCPTRSNDEVQRIVKTSSGGMVKVLDS
jgi:hypothetical protein